MCVLVAVIVIAVRCVYSLIDLINNVANIVRIVLYSRRESFCLFSRSNTHTRTRGVTPHWGSPGHRGIRV